jgi:hypothetical protein
MWCNTISQPKFGVPFSVAQTSKTASQDSKPASQDSKTRHAVCRQSICVSHTMSHTRPQAATVRYPCVISHASTCEGSAGHQRSVSATGRRNRQATVCLALGHLGTWACAEGDTCKSQRRQVERDTEALPRSISTPSHVLGRGTP